MSLNISGSEMSIDIAGLRENYTKDGLREQDLLEDPMLQFKQWLEEAVHSKIAEPNAMSLATVSDDGSPNVRIVLLKGVGDRSIRFFTNYNSNKGKDLSINPKAAVSFWWPELERQIRMKGSVEKVDRQESDDYFQSRPRESKLGAWASEQSKVVENRDQLKDAFDSAVKRFENKDVPTPENWGGYIINVDEIEFWQGRPGRLHDRILYCHEAGEWNIKRLQP